MPPITLSKEERKARREAKREKERAQNLGRAEKMHEARLATEIHGELPLEADSESAMAPAVPAINVGCSGWYYWHWKGTVYPEDIKTSAWFGYYADRLSTVELNAPFYSWPTVASVRSWIRQAGSRKFLYTVKVCELITHIKKFESTATLIKDFGYIADVLGPYVGCFLFQLPPSYDFTPARLQEIISQLDPSRRNVVEFRHKSWWNDDVYSAFRAHGIIFCSSSAPRLPDALIRTADDIYIRFHGTKKWYDHDYSEDELRMWWERIQESGAKRVWAYFNNDRNGFSVNNAQSFYKMITEVDGC